MLATGRMHRRSKVHKAAVKRVAFTPDGSETISGDENQTVVVMETATGRTIRSFAGKKEALSNMMPTAIAFSGDRRLVLLGNRRNQLFPQAVTATFVCGMSPADDRCGLSKGNWQRCWQPTIHRTGDLSSRVPIMGTWFYGIFQWASLRNALRATPKKCSVFHSPRMATMPCPVVRTIRSNYGTSGKGNQSEHLPGKPPT